MTGPQRRFEPAELVVPGEPEPSSAEMADALALARELEAFTFDGGIRPSDGFEDRVMAAVVAAPAPRLVVRDGSTVRGGRIGAFLLAIRESWGVATTGGRPMAIRMQALAFVLLVVVAAGATAGVTAVTVGALFTPNGPTVAPSQDPTAPTISPSPTQTAAPTQTATPTASPSPTDTAEPTETPEATETADPAKTPKPGETPRPTRTPRPTETPKGTDDHSGPGGGGGGGGSDDGGGDDHGGGGPGPG